MGEFAQFNLEALGQSEVRMPHGLPPMTETITGPEAEADAAAALESGERCQTPPSAVAAPAASAAAEQLADLSGRCRQLVTIVSEKL